jgi:hypothetical protein
VIIATLTHLMAAELENGMVEMLTRLHDIFLDVSLEPLFNMFHFPRRIHMELNGMEMIS